MFAVIRSALMFVLKFFRLDKVISYLLGFFSSAGPIASFFAFIGKKLAIKAIILPIQFVFLGALVVARIAFFTSLLSLIFWVYNRFHDVLILLNSNVVSDTSSFIYISWQVLQSIGFVDALFNSLQSLSFVWFTILILFVSKLVLSSLKDFSDEYFKIGLLLED